VTDLLNQLTFKCVTKS